MKERRLDRHPNDERLARFLAAYERTQNVSAAMREVDLTSRSTAYRWLRWYREDSPVPPRPRTRARRTKRTAEAVKDEIVDVREEHPLWGRRQITTELTRRHGRQIVSPASVERILRQRGLWRTGQGIALTGWTETARLDTDRLLEACQRGIQLDVHNQVLGAVSVLEEEVWHRIGPDPARHAALLQTPVLGSWLLRSLVHLGHALITIGRSYSAWEYLEAARHWLQTLPSSWRQVAFQESAQWISDGPGTPWIRMAHGVRDPLPRPWVSLRRDDVWIECCQYLGVVLRDDPKWGGLAALRQGLEVFDSRSRRQVTPRYPANPRGTLEHDLGRLMLRMGNYQASEIERHLTEAEDQMCIAQTQGAWGHGMLATIAIARSLLYRHVSTLTPVGSTGWARELERMAATTMSAIDHAERDGTPIIGVTVVFEAAGLLLSAGMANDLDRARLYQAADICTTNGYAGQARELLAIPGIKHHVSPEALAQLSSLIAEARRL